MKDGNLPLTSRKLLPSQLEKESPESGRNPVCHQLANSKKYSKFQEGLHTAHSDGEQF